MTQLLLLCIIQSTVVFLCLYVSCRSGAHRRAAAACLQSRRFPAVTCVCVHALMLLHSSPLVAKQLATPAPPSEPSPSPVARRSVPCTTERRPSESARVSQVDGTETPTETPPIPPDDAPAPLREPLPPQPPLFAPGDALREETFPRTGCARKRRPSRSGRSGRGRRRRRRGARRKKKQRTRAHADSHARERSSVCRWTYRPSVHAFCPMRESPASPDLASDALTSLLYPNYTPAHVKGKPPIDMLNESLRGPSANIREQG
eukprot:Opistho-1_new@59209